MVVEGDDTLGRPSQIGHDEADVRDAGASGEHPAAGGRALLGLAVRWYPSLTWGHGHGASRECSSHGGRALDGGLVAWPRLYRRPKAWTGYSRPLSMSSSLLRASGPKGPAPEEPRQWCTVSTLAHRGWDPADPLRFRPEWQVVPTLARRAQARQSPQRRPRDASSSSVTSGDNQFPSVERSPRPSLSAGRKPHPEGARAAIVEGTRAFYGRNAGSPPHAPSIRSEASGEVVAASISNWCPALSRGEF